MQTRQLHFAMGTPPTCYKWVPPFGAPIHLPKIFLRGVLQAPPDTLFRIDA
jgi:hypothetical protein